MYIRPIKKTDDAPLAKIIRTNLEFFNLAIPGTAFYDPELDHLSLYYGKSPRRNYFVGIENNELVGGIGIAEFLMDKNICELQKLYLKDDAKGKGYSHQLMNTALNFAKEACYTAVYLESHHRLTAALKLYQKYDFKILAKPLAPSPHNAMDRFLLKEL